MRLPRPPPMQQIPILLRVKSQFLMTLYEPSMNWPSAIPFVPHTTFTFFLLYYHLPASSLRVSLLWPSPPFWKNKCPSCENMLQNLVLDDPLPGRLSSWKPLESHSFRSFNSDEIWPSQRLSLTIPSQTAPPLPLSFYPALFFSQNWPSRDTVNT